MSLRLPPPPPAPTSARARSRPAPRSPSAPELARLAERLLRATPDVCRDGATALLLEIGRTAHFFGGETALAGRVRELARKLGFESAIGVAPTPEAARTLARAAILEQGLDAWPRFATTVGELARLPWQALDPARAMAETFPFLGVRTIGELVQLPRAGLATRTGAEFVLQLERLLGERAEPLPRIAPPWRFEESLELGGAVIDAGSVLHAARELFARAETQLERRGRALVSARVTLVPLDRRAGDPAKGERTIELAPSEPTRDAVLLGRLLAHRLERERLEAPVEIVRLAFDHTLDQRAAQDPLFAAGDLTRERDLERDVAALRDRLAVRLGRERVLAAVLVADHRPERAFRLIGLESAAQRAKQSKRPSASERPAGLPPAPPGPRPLDLEPRPQPVAIEADADGRPCALRCGERALALRVVRGPERIASGWWDGHDVDRAYFEVESSDGSRLWLFRDRKPARPPAPPFRWYRHGTFN